MTEIKRALLDLMRMMHYMSQMLHTQKLLHQKYKCNTCFYVNGPIRNNAKWLQSKWSIKWSLFWCNMYIRSWLSDADTTVLTLDGYELISQGKIYSAHGGLLIYLRQEYNYKNLPLCTHSDI